MYKNRNFMSKSIALMVLFMVLFTTYFLVRTYLDLNHHDQEVVDKKTPYALRRNATVYQKKLHTDLETALNEKKDLDAAKALAESFIADFYTWTNKKRFNDIGGVHLIHYDLQKSFYDEALETFYKDFNVYLKENKLSSSLEVKSSQARVRQGDIIFNDELRKAYHVDVVWEYEESDFLDLTDFQRSATITIVKDQDGFFSIVEVSDYEY